MSQAKRSVLITGCSDGGLGAALAEAFHRAGYQTYATARNPDKMKALERSGITTLTLDVLSKESIEACVTKIPALDILVNNAGCQYMMPVADIDLQVAKQAFDLNVWSHIAVVQAFLPSLLKSRNAIVVNHTSVSSIMTMPYQGVYNASKAAAAVLSHTMRLELSPFNIRVVDLKSGVVESNLMQNMQSNVYTSLPADSIYRPARKEIEKVLKSDGSADSKAMPASKWAELVVKDLGKPSNIVIWRGDLATLARLTMWLPTWIVDFVVKKMSGLDLVEKILRR